MPATPRSRLQSQPNGPVAFDGVRSDLILFETFVGLLENTSHLTLRNKLRHIFIQVLSFNIAQPSWKTLLTHLNSISGPDTGR